MLYVPYVPELLDFYSMLRAHFSHKNPDFYRARNQNRWTGNIDREIKTWMKVVHPKYGNCIGIPRGGTNYIRKISKEFDIKISWVDERHECKPITHLHNDVKLWPEQQKLAELMFAKENCIIKSPTGSGKTELLLKVTEWILKTSGPVLVVVWETGLFNQWIERIRERFDLPEKEVGMLGGGKKRIKPITVAMQQTLKNMGRQIIFKFGGVICDEIQKFAADTFRKVVSIMPSRYRLGASADATRKDGKEFLIYDMFGEPAGEIEKASLIDKGKIHDVTIRIIPTNFDLRYKIENSDETISWGDLPSDKKNYHELLSAINENKERNDLIWKFIKPCLDTDHTIMVATARVEHAKYWDMRIREAGYNCGLMLGGNDYAKEFDVTARSLRQRKIQAGIGTIQKIGVGHDIPSWNRGFILSPLAGNKQLFEQIVGRLRRTCDGKDDAVMYYFWENKIYSFHKRRLAKIYKGSTELYVDGDFLQI